MSDSAQRLNAAFQEHMAGRLQQAELMYHQLLAEQPDNADALHLLGALAHQVGNNEAAAELMGKAVAMRPKSADFHSNLGNVLQALGRLDDAIASFRRATQLQPDHAIAHYNLGSALAARGDLNGAIAEQITSIKLQPDFPGSHNNLGLALKAKLRPDEAVDCFRRAIAIDPNYAPAYVNLGLALASQGRLTDAIDSLQRVLQMSPDPEVLNNLGLVVMEQGRLDEAIELFRRALQMQPNLAVAHSNLLLAMNYHENISPADVFAEHVKFGRHYAPLAPTIPPVHVAASHQKLRIGYVSLDFREHPVGRFIEPVLESHDSERFEIFCYADLPHPDQMTDRLRAHANEWRNIFGLRDEQVAQQIRADKIDILVDLAGHTARNRLLVFAQKPAPIQATYLGYPNTTGLAAIDYRITDSVADPAGNESMSVEKLARLPKVAWCYRPIERAPDTARQTAEHVTFASFNALVKLRPPMIELWSRLLKNFGNSRLILKAGSLRDEPTRRRILEQFASHGIALDRINLLGPTQSLQEHLAIYNRLDVALDTFPYSGTTTTCEALWMGVPVVTLAGTVHASRVGLSLLTSIGLEEFAATTPDQYLSIATNLANDPKRLREIRSTLRARMQSSPLMDAPGFTAALEQLYRQMLGQAVS